MNSGPHDHDDATSRPDADAGLAGCTSTDSAKSASQAVDRAVHEFVEELRRRQTGDASA
jgi:hypothetical protein